MDFNLEKKVTSFLFFISASRKRASDISRVGSIQPVVILDCRFTYKLLDFKARARSKDTFVRRTLTWISPTRRPHENFFEGSSWFVIRYPIILPWWTGKCFTLYLHRRQRSSIIDVFHIERDNMQNRLSGVNPYPFKNNQKTVIYSPSWYKNMIVACRQWMVMYLPRQGF